MRWYRYHSREKKQEELNEKVDLIVEKFIDQKHAQAKKPAENVSRTSSCRARLTKTSSSLLCEEKVLVQKSRNFLTDKEKARIAEEEAVRAHQEKFRQDFNQGKVKESDIKALYSIGSVIGEGAFGSVRKAQHRLTHKVVAIKSYSSSELDSRCSNFGNAKSDRQRKKNYVLAVEEAKIMAELKHPNIIQYYHSITTAESLHIVLEFATDGSLGDYLHLKYRTGMPEILAKDILRQILIGLRYVHGKHFAHRDIKTDNILMNGGIAKISDFGIAKRISPGSLYKSDSGTTSYLSPQALSSEKCDLFLGDMWSLGVIFYEMISGKHPFRRTTDKDTHKAILSKQISFPVYISNPCRSYLEMFLNRDESKRLSSKEALKHSWVGLYSLPKLGPVAFNPEALKHASHILDMKGKELEHMLIDDACNYRTTTYYLLDRRD